MPTCQIVCRVDSITVQTQHSFFPIYCVHGLLPDGLQFARYYTVSCTTIGLTLELEAARDYISPLSRTLVSAIRPRHAKSILCC